MSRYGGRNKKALLIGINYTGSAHELNGCHADVENVGRFLNHHGYPNGPNSRVVLRDDLEVSKARFNFTRVRTDPECVLAGQVQPYRSEHARCNGLAGERGEHDLLLPLLWPRRASEGHR